MNSCPWCGKPKGNSDKRLKTCGSRACITAEQQATRRKNKYGYGALHEPWGIPKHSKRKAVYEKKKKANGGIPIAQCKGCKYIIGGRCLCWSGDLRARFLYKECVMKKWK